MLYKAQPMFDAFSGQCSCRLEMLSSFLELLAVVKTNDVLLELQAAMPSGVLDTMSLKLVPGINVMPESVQVSDLKPQELHISGLVKALHKLQVSGMKGSNALHASGCSERTHFALICETIISRSRRGAKESPTRTRTRTLCGNKIQEIALQCTPVMFPATAIASGTGGFFKVQYYVRQALNVLFEFNGAKGQTSRILFHEFKSSCS
ncbi:uncharacterized protein LOC117892141 isoform X2 [Drosophila subobscura]|uniref:uncharacterized protein LOC117892141 isoform X2 n=1 Tax=Drosophila subobscura TaxID=7241 RepID=UPI00155AC62C|nr:uncharacterized protein LOC117892141 isoform X2 [Drosophila subobscura]